MAHAATPHPATEILLQHIESISAIRDVSRIGSVLLDLEAELESGFVDFLKENFHPDMVKYFRNIAVQTKLVQKVPDLEPLILKLPLSHAAALLSATEKQLEEILLSGAKWTIATIKDKLQRKLAPGKVVGDREWEIAQERLGIGEIELPLLREQAQAYAEAEGSELTTDMLCAVLEKAGHKTSKIIKPKKAPKAVKSPVPDDLGNLMLERNSLQMEYDKCVTEEGKSVLRRELNQANREIARLTGIAPEPIVDRLVEENEQLRQQLAAVTAVEEVSEQAIVPQPASNPKKRLPMTNVCDVFVDLAAKLVEILPRVASARSKKERLRQIEAFLSKFQVSYA